MLTAFYGLHSFFRFRFVQISVQLWLLHLHRLRISCEDRIWLPVSSLHCHLCRLLLAGGSQMPTKHVNPLSDFCGLLAIMAVPNVYQVQHHVQIRVLHESDGPIEGHQIPTLPHKLDNQRSPSTPPLVKPRPQLPLPWASPHKSFNNLHWWNSHKISLSFENRVPSLVLVYAFVCTQIPNDIYSKTLCHV